MNGTSRSRNPNLRSSIYKGSDGYWHGRITVGIKDDGKPDRRHVRGTSRAAVADKVRKLEKERDKGAVRKLGERWTVDRWLTHWLHTIATPPRVTVNTHDGYRIDVEKHLAPGVGAHWLPLVENALEDNTDSVDIGELQDAFADVHTAMSGAADVSRDEK